MNVVLRESRRSDLPFMREMLYEAVFWRKSASTPTLEDGLAYPDVKKSLADWGERDGDFAVIAEVDSVPVGAAWYRFWKDDDSIRGYVAETMPVLVIGVHRDHRHQGIGSKMMAWLIDHSTGGSFREISLSVSKDNYAINLYRQHGFQEHTDIGDSFLMVRTL